MTFTFSKDQFVRPRNAVEQEAVDAGFAVWLNAIPLG